MRAHMTKGVRGEAAETMGRKAGLAAMIGGAALAVLASSAARAGELRAKDLAAAGSVDVLPVAQFTADPGQTSQMSLAPAPHRTLQLDSKGRWGFRLDMDQPTARDQDFRDVQAGAYYRFGRSLRVGGSLGFGPSPSPGTLRPQDDAGPRVRLESNFKF